MVKVGKIGGPHFLRPHRHPVRDNARAYNRILKVARTIADIEGSEKIKSPHLMEAAGYRFLDKITID